MHSLERLLARDELYRVEVSSQVAISQGEIADGVDRSAFVLILNSYMMKSESGARSLAAALNKAGENHLPGMLIDDVLSHDTISIRFGDLKEAPEAEAFSIDSIGKAVAFNSPGEGWIVFQLLDRVENEAYLKSSGHERQEMAKRLIQRRKEGSFSDRFLRGVFSQSIRLDSASFHLLAERLRLIMVADSAGRWEQGTIGVHVGDIDTLKSSLASMLEQPIATMAGYEVSMGELIDEFSYWPVRFSSLRRSTFLQTLNQAVQSLAQAGFISNEAINRWMQERPGVRRDLRMWGDATQADQMLRHLVDSIATALNSDEGSQRTLDPSIDPALKPLDMMDSYLATLAEKYGVELYLNRLKNVGINPHNMVTKRFIGFGGVTMGAPMIMRLWNWIHEWEARKSSHP